MVEDIRAGAEGGAYAIAANMAQSIAVNVLSAQAINLTDPIFEALGISSGSDSDALYFQQIQSSLTVIEGDLTKITARIADLAVGIAAIERTLTAITSEIKDAELQTQLTQYTENANVIEQNYQSFTAALAGMGSTTTFQQGTSALYNLFQTNNADAVATAMRNIHDTLVGAGELRGILSYQGLELDGPYTAWAGDPANVLRVAWPSLPGWPNNMGSWFDCFPDGSLVVEALPQILDTTFTTVIIPALTAAMAIQLKGLSFLCAAWGGTINEANLGTHTQNLTDIVTAIQDLFASFDLDGAVANAVQSAQSARLTPDQIAQPWDYGNPSTTCPFTTQDWMLWSLGLENPKDAPQFLNRYQSGLLQTPWRFGSCAGYSVDEGCIEHENPDGSFTTCPYGALSIAPFTITPPSQSGIAPPASFATFVTSLPAAPTPSAP